MRRQALVERSEFDWWEREQILKKTNNKCAHCGAPLTVGLSMTIDHFVPISKGGINQNINLIPLCDDCNSRKRNKIVSPDWYLKYIRTEDKAKVADYFDSYIRSFEYVSRNNLLACDLYELKVYRHDFVSKNKKRKKIQNMMANKFLFERVYPDELSDIREFYITYLKKYNLLDSEDAANKNIDFWNKFGVIYCVRDKVTNVIKMILPLVLGFDWNNDYYLNMFILSLYASSISVALVDQLPEFFAQTIMHEQKLAELRVLLSIPRNDKLHTILYEYDDGEGPFAVAPIIFGNKVDKDFIPEDKHPFYTILNDVDKYLDAFFAQPGYESIDFMRDFVHLNNAEKE